jgi:hypothetical protein
MTKIEFIQIIGNEVCEGCSPDRDCGLEYEDCPHIKYALDALQDLIDGEIKLED